MGCLFSYPAFQSKSIDDYASFINNDTMELLLKNDESIFNIDSYSPALEFFDPSSSNADDLKAIFLPQKFLLIFFSTSS